MRLPGAMLGKMRGSLKGQAMKKQPKVSP